FTLVIEASTGALTPATANLQVFCGPPVYDIRINEVDPGNYDAVELYNAGGVTANLTGWELIAGWGTGNLVYTFPSGFTLAPGAYVVVREGNGTDTASRLFTGAEIIWPYSGGSVGLTNGDVGIDFMRYGSSTDSPPTGTSWSGTLAATTMPQVYGRNASSTDSDNATDWTPRPGTLGTQNNKTWSCFGSGYLENTDSRLVYEGSWGYLGEANASGGSLHYTSTSFARVSFCYTANNMAIYRTLDPNRGTMLVCVDGSCINVNNYSATTQWIQPVIYTPGSGTHYVSITYVGPNYIDLDAVEVGSTPAAPSNLTGSAGTYQAQLDWNDNSSNEDGFRIFRGGVEVGTVGANTTSYTDTTPTCGSALAYTVRAYNAFGESSASNTFNVTPDCPSVLTAGYYEETDLNIVYSGGWGTYFGSDPSGGSLRYTADPSATVSFQVQGDVLEVVYTKYGLFGPMQICVDSDCATVDSYGDPPEWRKVWRYVNLGPGTHTVTISNASTAYISFDAVRVIDVTPLTDGLWQENNSNIYTLGSWINYAGDGPSAGALYYGSDPNGEVYFEFTGTAMAIYYVRYPGFGTMRVCVDGFTCTDISNHGAWQWQATQAFTGLSAGNHRVHITNLSGGNISFDAVAVGVPAAQPSITSSSVGVHSFTLNWGDISGEDGYRIFRDGAEVATVGAGVTTYTGSSRTCGEAATYTISSYNAFGNSTPSTGVSLTPSCPTPLASGAIYQESDPDIFYFSSWSNYSNPSANGGALYFSGMADAGISFQIDGRSFVLYYGRYVGFGSIDVCIDDNPCQTVSQNATTLVLQDTIIFQGLSAGTHHVVINANGDGSVTFDAVHVFATTVPVWDAVEPIVVEDAGPLPSVPGPAALPEQTADSPVADDSAGVG
ncbi:MAG: lamin tail domain-containing protein, partial [Chloroflexi bacterium]|nr:lamin tail domain-containing protein [Chloroflexota bacterium]